MSATLPHAATAGRSRLDDYIERRQVPIGKLRRVFGPLSAQRRLVDQLLTTLAEYSPEPPPGYEKWSLPRIAQTAHLMRRWATPGQTILDIASGAHFSLLLADSLPGRSWQATEHGGETVTFESRVGPYRYNYRPAPFTLTASRQQLPEDWRRPDVVTLFEVVEHLPWSPCWLFGSVAEALPDGGLFILSTPNLASRSAMMRLLAGGSPHQTPLIGNVENWHLHTKEYTPWELRLLLEWAGFEITERVTANVYLDDPRGWRAWAHHAGLLAGAVLSGSATEVRNLLRLSGSTQWVLARKARVCDWSRPMPAV